MAGLGVPGRVMTASAYGYGDPLPTFGRGIYNREEFNKTRAAAIREQHHAKAMKKHAEYVADEVSDVMEAERGLLYKLGLEREAYGIEDLEQDLDKRYSDEDTYDRIWDAQSDWRRGKSFAEREAIYAKRLDKLGHDAVWLGGDAGDKATKRYKEAQAYYDKWIPEEHLLLSKEVEVQRWKDASYAPFFRMKKAPPAPHESLEKESIRRPGDQRNDTRYVMWMDKHLSERNKGWPRLRKRQRVPFYMMRMNDPEPKPKRLAFE